MISGYGLVRFLQKAGMMVDADIAAGDDLIRGVKRLLADSRIRYLQAHYAKAGCYAARIVRACNMAMPQKPPWCRAALKET